MALDGFFVIDRTECREDGYRVDVTLLSGHPVYEGHFPGQPVVPGVCTLTVIRQALSAVSGRDIMFSAIKECKFLSALIPVEDIRLTIDMTLGVDGKLKCNVLKEDNIVLKLNATVSDI